MQPGAPGRGEQAAVFVMGLLLFSPFFMYPIGLYLELTDQSRRAEAAEPARVAHVREQLKWDKQFELALEIAHQRLWQQRIRYAISLVHPPDECPEWDKQWEQKHENAEQQCPVWQRLLDDISPLFPDHVKPAIPSKLDAPGR
jgi:hypothetical protein